MPESTRVVTGPVRLSYVHLFEPYSNDPDKDPKYSVTLLIPKSDKATISKLQSAIRAAAESPNGKTKIGNVKNYKTTLHDADEEADLDKNPEMRGHMYMAVTSNRKPGVVDKNRLPITEQSDVYSGCWGRVSLNAFAYSNSGNKGVSFGLGNVQKLRDDEPLDGSIRAEAEFDDEFSDSEDDLI